MILLLIKKPIRNIFKLQEKIHKKICLTLKTDNRFNKHSKILEINHLIADIINFKISKQHHKKH